MNADKAKAILLDPAVKVAPPLSLSLSFSLFRSLALSHSLYPSLFLPLPPSPPPLLHLLCAKTTTCAELSCPVHEQAFWADRGVGNPLSLLGRLKRGQPIELPAGQTLRPEQGPDHMHLVQDAVCQMRAVPPHKRHCSTAHLPKMSLPEG